MGRGKIECKENSQRRFYSGLFLLKFIFSKIVKQKKMLFCKKDFKNPKVFAKVFNYEARLQVKASL